jgi:hypothetical protein
MRGADRVKSRIDPCVKCFTEGIGDADDISLVGREPAPNTKPEGINDVPVNDRVTHPDSRTHGLPG